MLIPTLGTITLKNGSYQMRVKSINVGLPKEVIFEGNVIETAIYKYPVEGPVYLNGYNLEGDCQADLSSHGGGAKSVYAYPEEHYSIWKKELKRKDLQPGQFGENLTVTGLSEKEVFIGNKYKIGKAILEVTQPRMPCLKPAIRMNSKPILELFLKSGRTGFYFRVIEKGHLEKGNFIECLEQDANGISVHDIWRMSLIDFDDAESIHRALQLKFLGPEWRLALEKRLK